jgi:ubiquinone/menaquinone biosynthesis C-methylase UbiE
MTGAGEAAAQKAAVGGVFDRASGGYDEGGIAFFGPAGLDLVERADPRPGERVLDVGSGKGASALPAAERVGPGGLVLAVDIAPGMVAGLRSRAVDAGLANLTATVGDAEAPPATPGVWDLIQSSLTLFFLPHLDVALARYRELLRPGGRLAFSWFGDDDPRWNEVYRTLVAEIPGSEDTPRRPGGDAFSSPASIAEALERAGFREVTTEEVVMDVAVPSGAVWWEHQWTHGRRFTLERLEQLGRLESSRERTVAAVEALREEDGTLAWRPTIRHTVAVA